MVLHRFELVGGNAALDFLNTVHDWTEQPRRDYLTSFGEAVRWGEATGLLTRGEARRLHSRESRAELARLIELRAVLQRVVSALIARRSPLATDLEALAASAAEAAEATRLRGAHGALLRSVAIDDAGPAVLRLRIAETALALLTTDFVERVKSCPACGWFFVDTSKNRSRRWCSMATCGSIAKSKRYYHRIRESRPHGG